MKAEINVSEAKLYKQQTIIKLTDAKNNSDMKFSVAPSEVDKV